MDGNGIKQLRVNPSTGEVSDLDTFSTVAHEGYPGHMYQYAYMYENIQSPYQKALANSSAIQKDMRYMPNFMHINI